MNTQSNPNLTLSTINIKIKTYADSTKVMLLAVFYFYVFYYKSSITCSISRKYFSTCRYTHFTNMLRVLHETL